MTQEATTQPHTSYPSQVKGTSKSDPELWAKIMRLAAIINLEEHRK